MAVARTARKFNAAGRFLLRLEKCIITCRVPDDSIDARRSPLFMGREVMRWLFER